MAKFLIFRTDRIGDFLISTPIFSSLKRKFINCKITNWAYGIMSNFDIDNTVIDKCHFDYCGNAINLGVNMTLSTPATNDTTGPIHSSRHTD